MLERVPMSISGTPSTFCQLRYVVAQQVYDWHLNAEKADDYALEEGLVIITPPAKDALKHHILCIFFTFVRVQRTKYTKGYQASSYCFVY